MIPSDLLNDKEYNFVVHFDSIDTGISGAKLVLFQLPHIFMQRTDFLKMVYSYKAFLGIHVTNIVI